jgi:hypothetical protein
MTSIRGMTLPELGAGGICCIWLPALGGSAAKMPLEKASTAYVNVYLFSMVTLIGKKLKHARCV